MSIHNGNEVWAGRDMEHHPTLGSGSAVTISDEGTNIKWGFWLGADLTTEEAQHMISKLLAELLTHGGIYHGA